MEDDSSSKLKKIVIFNLNKSIIGLAKEFLLMLEHAKLDRNVFERDRKFVLDSANSTIRELTEIINEAL